VRADPSARRGPCSSPRRALLPTDDDGLPALEKVKPQGAWPARSSAIAGVSGTTGQTQLVEVLSGQLPPDRWPHHHQETSRSSRPASASSTGSRCSGSRKSRSRTPQCRRMTITRETWRSAPSTGRPYAKLGLGGSRRGRCGRRRARADRPLYRVRTTLARGSKSPISPGGKRAARRCWRASLYRRGRRAHRRQPPASGLDFRVGLPKNPLPRSWSSAIAVRRCCWSRKISTRFSSSADRVRGDVGKAPSTTVSPVGRDRPRHHRASTMGRALSAFWGPAPRMVPCMVRNLAAGPPRLRTRVRRKHES